MSTQKWLEKTSSSSSSSLKVHQEIKFFALNAFHLDQIHTNKYDRIYIGAGCREEHISFFQSFLSLEGILIAPMENELVKIVRTSNEEFSSTVINAVQFAPLVESQDAIKVENRITLPRSLWTPSSFLSFPSSFRSSMKTLLLTQRRASVKYQLPNEVWLNVFSYLTR